MSVGRQAVHARRARLLERAAGERDELAGLLGAWRKPMGAVDQGLAFVRALKRGAPAIGMVVGAGMAALAFVRPTSIRGWVEGGQAVWRLLSGRKRRAAPRSRRSLKPAAGGDPK